MRQKIWLACMAFLLTWIPLSVWRGIEIGRTHRIGSDAQSSIGPLIEGVIQLAFVMLAPALLVALMVFALLSWREELTGRRRVRGI